MVLAATNNFLVPNGTFVVELIIFLIILWFLGKYVVPRLRTTMDERQETLRRALEDAEEARERHQQAEEEYRRSMEQARAEARRLVDEAKAFSDQMRADAHGRAETEYRSIIERAQADIDSRARQASEELRAQLSDLVMVVVEKVVGEALDVQAQRNLIDRTIAEVERESGNAGVNA
ncbi:MAG TPA: F0F1 ATP synthase subunit B [Acidimicrobiales bacterium]|nr:F0F1 ATP synthase subunit B [Acidimicrobiales bacterium]